MNDQFRRLPVLGLAALGAVFAPPAGANCGAAVCTLNTQWETQGVSTRSGWRFDAAYEFVEQDQARSGTDDLDKDEIPRDHGIVLTVSRTVKLAAAYSAGRTWGVTATLPIINRRNRIITPPEEGATDDGAGGVTVTPVAASGARPGALPRQDAGVVPLHAGHDHGPSGGVDSWEFTRPGDLRVLGRLGIGSGAAGVLAGLKLPTGPFGFTNDEGFRLERSLQAGTGTTDSLLGAYYSYTHPVSSHGFFAQALWQHALYERSGYQPGDSLALDLGYRYALTGNIGLALQLNGLIRDRDDGEEAAPADTGSEELYASPGITFQPMRRLQLYAFAQLPVYRRVNGIQEVSDYNLAGGVSLRF